MSKRLAYLHVVAHLRSITEWHADPGQVARETQPHFQNALFKHKDTQL